MSSSHILILNATVYTITLLIYYVKSKSFNVGTLILLLYSFTAWASVLFYNHNLFRYSIHYSKITLLPFIYLYIVLMLFFYPFLKFKSNNIKYIKPPNPNKFSVIIIGLTIVQFFDFLLQIPSINQILHNNINWGETRSVIYENEDWFWFNKYSLLSHIHLLAGALTPLVLTLAFYSYFVLQVRNKWNAIFFYVTILTLVINQILVAGRGMLLIRIIFLLSLVLLFRGFIPEKKLKKLKFLSIAFVVPFIFFFISVSQSRFSEYASYMYYKYAGENYINFNGLMYHNLKGTTNGTAYFTFFTRVFNPDGINYNTSLEKWEYIQNKTNVSGQYFYTFVGAFCFEFGKVGTLLLAIISSILVGGVLSKSKQITISLILFYSTGIYILINGVFFFILQGSAGNLTIILMFILMVAFKGIRFN